MTYSALILTALAGAIAGQAAPSSLPNQPDKGSFHAKPRLISERSSLVPGETAWIGLTFDIDPGWHTYWDGAGDTGQPVNAKFTLPEGYTVGEILWPTPERLVSPGEILDYVYEKRVTALISITVPMNAKTGDDISLSANLWWLECEDICIPRKADVTLSLPVAAAGATPDPTKDAPRFDEARKRVPRPVAEGKKAYRAEWVGDRLRIQAPGAVGIVFYPHVTSLPMSDALHEGMRKGDQLDMEFRPRDGARVLGILEVRRPDDRSKEETDTERTTRARLISEFYTLDMPGPAAAAPPGNTKDPRKQQPGN